MLSELLAFYRRGVAKGLIVISPYSAESFVNFKQSNTPAM